MAAKDGILCFSSSGVAFLVELYVTDFHFKPSSWPFPPLRLIEFAIQFRLTVRAVVLSRHWRDSGSGVLAAALSNVNVIEFHKQASRILALSACIVVALGAIGEADNDTIKRVVFEENPSRLA